MEVGPILAALPAAQVERAIALGWKIDELKDAAELVQAAVPRGG